MRGAAAGATVPVRVVIVDDDALVRGGLSMLLGGAAGIEVVGEADGRHRGAGAPIDRHHPDVVLLDLRMPKLDGIGALALLQQQPKPPAVVVLTTFDTDDHLLQALRNGAAGFRSRTRHRLKSSGRSSWWRRGRACCRRLSPAS